MSLQELFEKVDSALRPSNYVTIPIDAWINYAVRDWLVPNFRWVFRAAQAPVDYVLRALNDLFQACPFSLALLIFVTIAWRLAGLRIATFTLAALLLLEALGVWDQLMTTLALIFTAVAFSVVIGVPLGILAATKPAFQGFLRPVLDVMQTIPPFVYLVPIVMLFGIGMVPGVIATIIFAMPPIIRLTTLGILQVPHELVEAGYAFGSTKRQVLWDVQLPLAMRTIMAGLNQTIMMALSMVVIAALIGAGGLGLTVYTGLGRLDIGMAFLGGLGIVLIAINLDRITQEIGKPDGTHH
jgi:glycine betaine/proline transport system permease protein